MIAGPKLTLELHLVIENVEGALSTDAHHVDMTNRRMRVWFTCVKGAQITRVESEDKHGNWEPDQLSIEMRNAAYVLIEQALRDSEDQMQLEIDAEDDPETERADSVGYA